MTSTKEKIFPREKLVKILEPLRKAGKTIGLTNGAFDILHAGHVTYLEEAKKKCDVLVVSINTDSSVKEYKGEGRPIMPEMERAMIVAALDSVDYVTFHSERRMKAALEAIKPKYYIKGGDYKETELTSRDVLKQWDGEIVLIPFVKGKSTTNIVKKIAEVYGSQPISIDSGKKELSNAVILDRDGVINEEVEFLHEPEKFKFIPAALEGIKKMQDAGYKIVIATTQAGIGLGYFTKEDFFKVNKTMLKGFNEHDIVISKIYFCPHSVSDNCTCRKPKIGLIERAKNDLNLDLAKSWVIGDKTSDIKAGKDAGCKTIIVKTGHKGEDKQHDIKPDFTAENLIEAADIIIK
jgi:rfaE bifunctional protein nucleotidyltransferase chain/domain|tara:strand:+ start:1546 stop:2595 length:1050 start_codon:yes stop_codon:yes gene_type:complete